MKTQPPARRHRAIWISDIHLGARGCEARKLSDSFKKTDSDYLSLAGDIVNGWRLKRAWRASAKTFRSCLHAFDPDLIGVGKSSEEETAEAAE